MASKTKMKRRAALVAAGAVVALCLALAASSAAAGGPAQLLERLTYKETPAEVPEDDPQDVGGGFVLNDGVKIYRGLATAPKYSQTSVKVSIATDDVISKGDLVYTTTESQESSGELGIVVKVDTATRLADGAQVTGSVPSLRDAVSTFNGKAIESDKTALADLGQYAKDKDLLAADRETSDSLTSEQRSAISGYSDEEKEIMQVLKSGVWSADGDSSTVRFGENSFIATSSGADPETSSFAITSMTTGERVPGDDGALVTPTYCAVLTDDGSHILIVKKYEASEARETSAVSYTIQSDAFPKDKASYLRKGAANDFRVVGMNAQIEALLAGHADEVREKVKEYANMLYPTATEAVWSKHAELDWEENTLVTAFALNTSSKVNVVLTYDLENQTISVGKN